MRPLSIRSRRRASRRCFPARATTTAIATRLTWRATATASCRRCTPPRFPEAMAETLSPRKDLEDLKAELLEVQELLRRHHLVEALVERQEMPKHELVGSLVHRQNVAELRGKLDLMHPADIAYVLESLPLEQR